MRKIAFFILLLAWASPALPSGLPVSFDLRDEGRVTGVKNQGTPGPCWAFAALGSCESSYLTQGLASLGKNPDLSEMHLAWFAYQDPGHSFTSRFSHRWALRQEGDVFRAAAVLARWGTVRERDLPYTLESVEALSRARPHLEDYPRCLRLRDVEIPVPATPELRKRLIRERGAIVVSFYSDRGRYHQGQGVTPPTYYNPGRGSTNHDVLLIGWDDHFPRERFDPQPPKDGAWLARDSWGVLLGGNRGEVWLSYAQPLVGGAAFVVGEAEPRLCHYGYDALGWCGVSDYRWAASVFRARGGETLKEVAFYTPENRTEYEIFVYGLGDFPSETGNGSPTDGPLLARLKGNLEFAGYHTLPLPHGVFTALRLKGGEAFAVVLRLDKPMPVETRIEGYSDDFTAGECWFSEDGLSWTAGAERERPMNACIKAFTVRKR